MSKNDSIFLTQGVASSRVRKKVVQNFVSQTQNNQIAEINSKTEQLLTTVQGIKPQESVSQYRQLKRQMKQAKIVSESQLSKVEKCTFIDLEYTRKCIANEPSPCYENILHVLEQQEQENEILLSQLKDLDKRLRNVEEEVG